MRAPRSLQGKSSLPRQARFLLPISANPHSAPAPPIPAAGNPHGPGSRRKCPGSGNPHPIATAPGPATRRPHGPRPGGHWNSFSPDRWRHSGCPSSCIRRPWRSGTGAYKARPSSPWPSSPSWPALGICVYHPCGNHTGGSQNNHFFLYHTSSEFLASVRFRQTHVMTNRGPRNGLECTVGGWERDARASRYGNIPICAVTSVVKAQSMRFTQHGKKVGR